MSDIYVPVDDPRAEFVPYLLGGYTILAPRFLAERHPRPAWERERFQSMQAGLHPGDILIDVGAEQGQQSAIYAGFVGGGENMVLVEPAPQAWPNIRRTWQANSLRNPLCTFCGFASYMSAESTFHDFESGYDGVWPKCASAPYLLDATKFRYASPNEQLSSTDSITLDDLCLTTGIHPAAITVDVEGYEPRVIEGAMSIIRACGPTIWISIHDGDNNMLKRFEGGDPVADLYRLMHELDYTGQELARDHELHTVWRPR